jgi:hypothetical protein
MNDFTLRGITIEEEQIKKLKRDNPNADWAQILADGFDATLHESKQEPLTTLEKSHFMKWLYEIL